MVTRVRSILDEANAGYWSDAEIYSALSDGQAEVTNYALSVYQGKFKQDRGTNIPITLNNLIKTVSTTLSVSNTVTLPTDYKLLVSVSLAYNGSLTKAPVFITQNDSINNFENANTYLKPSISNLQCYVDSNSGLHLLKLVTAIANDPIEYVYVAMPSAISSTVEPTITEIAHNAIISFACARLLLKDEQVARSQAEIANFFQLMQQEVL